MKHLYAFFLGLITLSSSLITAQTPCENGMAGIYPCNNIDLMSTITLEELGGVTNMNDIWGWTDEASAREFAIVGLRNGTSFVEVTDPLNPLVLGFLPTATGPSLWRDIKTFQHYAFIVSEAGGHGMQVFDLNRLLEDFEETPVEFDVDAYYDAFGNAHNIVINEESGFAYGVGTGTFQGGLHFVDINDPLNPQIAGGFAGDGYTHDAQIVNYTGPDGDYFDREIAFACNEDAVTIVDVTDKTDPVFISTIGYEFSAYTHQGWLTDDQAFFIFNDEIDESSGFTSTTKTFFLDVRDLDNPVIHHTFFSTSTAIDHNLYNNGSLCYQSNYRAGLRVLDIGNVYESDISELAFFDSQPTDDVQEYSGTWSNYVYFPSGTVIMSDMYSDFFILRPNVINAYRYAEVCSNTDRVDFYVDVASEQVITDAFTTDFLPADVTVEIGEIEAPGRIPVTVFFNSIIPEGEYLIPVELYNEDELVFSEQLKFITTFGDLPVFSGFSPEDSFQATSATVNLSWDAIDGVENYAIMIASDENFEDVIVDEEVSTTSYDFTQVGTFYWKVVAPSSCRVPIDSEVRSFSITVSSVDELDSTVKVFPNPAKDEITVEGFSGELVFYSVEGKEVMIYQITDSHTINVSDLAPGIYTVKTSTDAQLRLVKE